VVADDEGIEVVRTGVDSEVELVVAVDDNRTEIVGTGMAVANTEGCEVKSDVVAGIEVIKVTLGEDSVDIEKMLVVMGDEGIKVVGTKIEVVINDNSGIETEVVFGAEVLIGTVTEFVEIIGDCEIVTEVVDNRMEFVGITEGKDDINVAISQVPLTHI